MTSEIATVRCSLELYYDDESRNWGFSGQVLYGDGNRTGIVGGSDTLREAQREALDALAFTLDCLREDGLLPADPVEQAAATAS